MYFRTFEKCKQTADYLPGVFGIQGMFQFRILIQTKGFWHKGIGRNATLRYKVIGYVGKRVNCLDWSGTSFLHTYTKFNSKIDSVRVKPTRMASEANPPSL